MAAHQTLDFLLIPIRPLTPKAPLIIEPHTQVNVPHGLTLVTTTTQPISPTIPTIPRFPTTTTQIQPTVTNVNPRVPILPTIQPTTLSVPILPPTIQPNTLRVPILQPTILPTIPTIPRVPITPQITIQPTKLRAPITPQITPQITIQPNVTNVSPRVPISTTITQIQPTAATVATIIPTTTTQIQPTVTNVTPRAPILPITTTQIQPTVTNVNPRAPILPITTTQIQTTATTAARIIPTTRTIPVLPTIIPTTVPPRVQPIVQNIGYGFTEWRRFNANERICTQKQNVPENLLRAFVADIEAARAKNQSIVVLIHRGDAVKNTTTDQEEAQRIYNVLPPNWSQLSYEEKADIMRPMPENIDYKRWSRQQWPYNTIRYITRRNMKLIYVQSDHIYCRYPSLFAEAMCGTLYTEMTRIDNLFYNFKGENQSLYNVGDFAIVDSLSRAAEYYNIPIFSDIRLRNDLEWARMSDSFLDSFYDALIAGNNVDNVQSSYIYFPWERIYDNLQQGRTIEPIEVNIASLFGGARKAVGTFIKDLGLNENDKLIISGIPALPTWGNIPLSLLVTNERRINVMAALGVVQTMYITQNIQFNGTILNPQIVIDNKGVIPNDIIRVIIQR